ncbi:MAG: NIPSNAP family containing protein [Planctomycetota bacterium]|nr:MAG: NIPSNAP family containing protein [Planctomycetota bacterium]
MKLNQLSAWGLVLSVLLAIVALRSNPSNGQESKMTGVYELRTYTTLDGRLPNLHARFKNHTMKLFEKHGMKNVMYWTPTDSALIPNGTRLATNPRKTARSSPRSKRST